MREIKFRAYYEPLKKMYYTVWRKPIVNKLGTVGYQWFGLANGNEVVALEKDSTKIMQYTGLKDKNGQGIYKGDIVKGFGRKFLVKWGVIEREVLSDNGDINMVQIPSFYFEWEHQALYPIIKNYKGEHDLETLAVTGNKYDNPELLGDAHD